MVEKIITLENISLVDFLGVDNNNIKAVADSFPKTKIISRGNEIRIQGAGSEILRVNDLLNSLIDHYHKFGHITSGNVQNYVEQGIRCWSSAQEDVLIFGTRGAPIRSRTPNQKKFVDIVDKHDVVFAIGPAGTGKTYIAVALAVRALKNKEIKRIIITRPAVEAGENLGFLPGDLQEKIDPYLKPIYDALDDMIPSEKLKFYRENRVIEIAPLAYMRGRTLSNAFILLDEAQNTTPIQIKMFLTRLGQNSKLIINGDRTQVDLKPNQKSGLDEASQVLKGVKGIGFVELDETDVVRHAVVKEIIKAYDRFNKKG
ncbi:MAG: PhoH family protein [Cyclobacteriaceae bacterium]|nr:PhoH family protein [Cyclobacteriaceae bacterium]